MGVLSEQGDISWQLINQTHSLYQEWITRDLVALDSERRIASPNGMDSAQIQRQATLVRFLSITEAFATDLLYRRIESVMGEIDHPAGRIIWEDRYDQAISNWSSLREVFNGWFGVDKKLWTDLLELTEARNAVAHGHGRLTWKQRRKSAEALELKLRRRSIVVRNDLIILSDESLREAARTCREFIEQLDKSALAAL